MDPKDVYTYKIAIAGDFRMLDARKVYTPVHVFCKALCGTIFPVLRPHNLMFYLPETTKFKTQNIQAAIQELCSIYNYSYETRFLHRHSSIFCAYNAMIDEMLENANRVMCLCLEYQYQFYKFDKITKKLLDQATSRSIPVQFITYSSLMNYQASRIDRSDPLFSEFDELSKHAMNLPEPSLVKESQYGTSVY